MQQLKKGALSMLVLEAVCAGPTYGYELLSRIGGRFPIKEGTLYPILYRLEDDGLIEARWSAGEGRAAPKKIYAATEAGRAEALRRREVWREFSANVEGFYEEDVC